MNPLLALLSRIPFRRVPLIGRLVDCQGEDHWQALQELFTVQILSTLPIWLGTYITLVHTTVPAVTIMGAFYGTMNNGELFIYATSLCAPLFWIALKDPPGARAFPHKGAQMVLIGVVIAIAASSFGLLKAGDVTLNKDTLFRASVVLVCLSYFLLYLATVYNNFRVRSAPAEMHEQEDTFVNRVQEHRQ